MIFCPLDCVLWLFLFNIFVCYNRDSALPAVDWTLGGLNGWNQPKSDGVCLKAWLEGINRSKEPQKTHLPFLAGPSGAQVSKWLRAVWSWRHKSDVSASVQNPCCLSHTVCEWTEGNTQRRLSEVASSHLWTCRLCTHLFPPSIISICLTRDWRSGHCFPRLIANQFNSVCST